MAKTRKRNTRIRRCRRAMSGGDSDYLALDCEMIEGPKRRSMVAEVAVVEWDGEVVYHAFVKPTGPVVDYRTNISGITPEKLEGATPLRQVQADLVQLLDGKILVGHALENDLRALGLQVHPAFVRNTAHHPFFKTMAPRGQLQPRKLANLHLQYVGVPIQQGAHGAVEDAKASMAVYRTHHANWETPVVHEGPVLIRQNP